VATTTGVLGWLVDRLSVGGAVSRL